MQPLDESFAKQQACGRIHERCEGGDQNLCCLASTSPPQLKPRRFPISPDPLSSTPLPGARCLANMARSAACENESDCVLSSETAATGSHTVCTKLHATVVSSSLYGVWPLSHVCFEAHATLSELPPRRACGQPLHGLDRRVGDRRPPAGAPVDERHADKLHATARPPQLKPRRFPTSPDPPSSIPPPRAWRSRPRQHTAKCTITLIVFEWCWYVGCEKGS